MTLRRTFIAALGVGLLLSTAGCGKDEAADAKGRVAVIDLEKIAKELGEIERFNNAVSTERRRIQARLATLSKGLKAQLDDAQKEAGDNPTKEQAEQFQRMRFAANDQMQKAQQEASRAVTVRRVEIVQSFRDKVQPVAMKHARSRGLSVVVVKGESTLLAFDDTVDITLPVLAELRQSGLFGPMTAATSPAKTP